ncbi:MAG: tetratricopeptide repeat protein [Bacteroidota bacterium]
MTYQALPVRILSVFFISVFAVITGFSQPNEMPSAKLAVDTLFFKDKERALEICEQFLPVSLAEQDTFHITYFLDQAGELNRYLGNFNTAEKQLLKCLDYKTGWEDLKDLSITYNNLGKVYKQTGKFELAFDNFMQAYQLMEELDNPFGKGYYLNNLGTLFDDQHDYAKAIEYYNRSFEMKKITKDSTGMAATSYNVGILYYNLGRYEQALGYFQTSYESVSYTKSVRRKVLSLTNMAATLLELGRTDESRAKLDEAARYISEVKTPTVVLDFLSARTRLFMMTNQLDSAEVYNQQAYEKAISLELPIKIQRVIANKSEIFERRGEIDSAFYYLKAVNTYYDTIVTTASVQAIAELEGKYKFERNSRLLKEKELEVLYTESALQDKQLQLSYVVIALILVIGIAVAGFLKSRANKRNAELLKGQKMLIEHQNGQLNNINQNLSDELALMKMSVNEKEEILDKVFTKSDEGKLSPEIISLSKREREVLAHLALGLSDAQLADKLFLSKSTVKTHLRRIYSKLLVKNRAGAVAIAHKYEIIGTVGV